MLLDGDDLAVLDDYLATSPSMKAIFVRDNDRIRECAISARPERFGLSWIRRFWTCRSAAFVIAMQRMAPRMAPKRQTVHSSSRGEALSLQALLARPEELESPTF